MLCVRFHWLQHFEGIVVLCMYWGHSNILVATLRDEIHRYLKLKTTKIQERKHYIGMICSCLHSM